jgi:hypothetical protein
MGDHSVSATYRASPRYGGVWAASRAASPGLGPVGGVPRRGGPRLLLKELDGDPLRIQRRIPPRLGVEGSGRRFAPRRPVWGLLAGYWAVEVPASV